MKKHYFGLKKLLSKALYPKYRRVIITKTQDSFKKKRRNREGMNSF